MSARLPVGVARLVRRMKEGHRLFGGRFGMWTINPVNGRPSDLHRRTERSAIWRKVITRGTGDEWELAETAGVQKE